MRVCVRACKSATDNCFRKHEMEKKRAYERRVREIEHALFTPLVLSESRRLAKEATNFYKRLASKLAECVREYVRTAFLHAYIRWCVRA